MSRVIIDVRDAAGRLTSVEFAVHRDTVECWCTERCCAVFDRDGLREWLSTPSGVYGTDELVFTRTPVGDVALIIDGLVPWWPVPDHDLLGLTSRL
jgi:hypothetical protein